MAHPTFEDARRLGDWEPPLGVVSVYLAFDPADRGGAWRTELRNGLDALLEAAKDAEHERRVALRAVAKRILDRYEDGDHRPPPRGEAGFVEVAEKGGEEHWWGTGAVPEASACVELGERPALAPLVDLACRGEERGIAIVALERVRLLSFAEGQLTELEDWELELLSLGWRERKAQSGGPAHGVASSGKDEYGDRLDHNRHKFLAASGAFSRPGRACVYTRNLRRTISTATIRSQREHGCKRIRHRRSHCRRRWNHTPSKRRHRRDQR